jgi:hypothetical protein
VKKKNEYFTQIINNNVGGFSNFGLSPTLLFKENVILVDNVKTFFLKSYKDLSFLIGMVLLGFYNKNIIKYFFNNYSFNKSKNIYTQTNQSIYFNNYDFIFFNLNKVNKDILFTNNISVNLKNSPIKTIISFFLKIIFSISFILLFFYFIIFISYNYSFLLPHFGTFNLINLTILLFSLLNSGIVLENLVNNFIILITMVNYNNLDFIKTNLTTQEKYFSKYENTYFTDKKCGEGWVNSYYLPSEFLFKNSVIENFFNGDTINVKKLHPST